MLIRSGRLRAQAILFKPRSGRVGHTCPVATMNHMRQVIEFSKATESRVPLAMSVQESRRTGPGQAALPPLQTSWRGCPAELDGTDSCMGAPAHRCARKCRNRILVNTQHMMHWLLGTQVSRRTYSKYYTLPGTLSRRIAPPVPIGTTTGLQGIPPRAAGRIGCF